MQPAIAAVAGVLIVAVVAWQAALLAKAEPHRRAQRAALAQARARAAATRPKPTDLQGRIVWAVQHRPALARSLSGLTAVAFVVAIGLIGFPFYSNFIQSRIQDRLSHQLNSASLKQAYLERRVVEGDSLTRIQIPSIDLDVVVVEGTGADALRAGAGHYRSTPLPCENGNVAIAGHRTTYGRPFANLDLLHQGDEIKLTTPIGSCTYKVTATPQGRDALDDKQAAFVVNPTDIGVVANSSKPMLTLTTCHPKGSAAKRLVIQAVLVPAGV